MTLLTPQSKLTAEVDSCSPLWGHWVYVPCDPGQPHPGGVGLVELVEHDDGGAAIVVDQPPEVRCGTLQWVQGHDEGCAPCVALWGTRHSAGGASDGSNQLTPSLRRSPPVFCSI